MQTIDPTAFDTFAPSYDDDFTRSRLGRLLRQRVWRVLNRCFSVGDHVLEVACGTGEDAIWLAQQGVEVTATDGSAAMVRVASDKALAAGVSDLVHVQQLSLQEICEGRLLQQAPIYDGVLSNFGGLNTISNWRKFGEQTAHLLQPDARLVLVPMGPFCPWEIVWFATHLQMRKALRRYRQPASAYVGNITIPVWYPSARHLRAELAPWFQHLHTESLGLWLPPSYLDHFVDHFPRLSNILQRLEAATAPLSAGWGDHYISVYKRREVLSPT